MYKRIVKESIYCETFKGTREYGVPIQQGSETVVNSF